MLSSNRESLQTHHLFVWNPIFTTRRTKFHKKQDDRLTRQPNQSTVDAFLEEDRFELGPPHQFCGALRSFLKSARESDLTSSPSTSNEPASTEIIALVDDRQDDVGWPDVEETEKGAYRGARDWSGYALYPPEGANQRTGLLSTLGLWEYLKENVSAATSIIQDLFLWND
jgi:hypothetical protein